MAELATHLYLSRIGRYLSHPSWPDPVPDTVYAYAVNSDGSISALGSGTYSAAGDYYVPGAAYGYEPPTYLRDDPYWGTFNPTDTWYDFTGSALDYWDLRYGTTNSAIIRAKPTASTERPYISGNDTGDGLLVGFYDTSAISTGALNPDNAYLYIAPWYPPDDVPAIVQVLGVVDLTALYALHGISPDPTFHTADYFVAGAVEKPKFWANLVGTKETP